MCSDFGEEDGGELFQFGLAHTMDFAPKFRSADNLDTIQLAGRHPNEWFGKYSCTDTSGLVNRLFLPSPLAGEGGATRLRRSEASASPRRERLMRGCCNSARFHRMVR